MNSPVRNSASTDTRVGTRRATSSSTSRWATTAHAVQGHVKPSIWPAISMRRVSTATASVAPSDSHSAGTGRRSARTAAQPCATPSSME